MNPRFSTTASSPNMQHPKIGKLGQERYTCVGYACVPPLPASGRRPAVAQYYSPALNKKGPSCDHTQADRLRSRKRSGLLLSGWERTWLCTSSQSRGPESKQYAFLHHSGALTSRKLWFLPRSMFLAASGIIALQGTLFLLPGLSTVQARGLHFCPSAALLHSVIREDKASGLQERAAPRG